MTPRVIAPASPPMTALETALVRALPPCGQYRRCAGRDPVLSRHGTPARRQCGRRARYRCVRLNAEPVDLCERHLPAQR